MADPRKDSHLNYGLTQTNVQFRDQNYLNNGQDGLILAGVPNFAIPTSFSALAIGMLNRGADAWLLAYIESEFFKATQRKIKDRTKIDIAVLLAACVALRKVSTSIPDLLISFLDRFKQQATSSIRIGIDDSKYHGILRLAAEKSFSDCSWWLKLQFRGQHDYLKNDGKIVPQPGKADRFFWHDNTLFSLEVFGSVDSTGDEDSSENAYYRRNNDQSWDKQYLVLRCFGSSHSPIKGLMADVDKRLILSQHLQVTQVMADITKSPILRPKRPLTTIDMDPEQLETIREDAEAFFDESTPILCRDTGTPHRRGYLLYGPPGTGKSSLSVAIPSHVNVDLVIITLHGMDDKRLEEVFSALPSRCVALVEDIDCAGAQVRRGAQKSDNADDSDDDEEDKIEIEVAANLIERTMEKHLEEQRQHNETMLERFTEFVQRNTSRQYSREPPKPVVPPIPKQVTLSGLLNAIDGATAGEGRLLILTTNHPERLDPALLWKGRIDRHFEIGYATKITAELTFKRIFGQDTRKYHTIEAINRFAKAFKDQFPTHSKIPTATVAQYCMQYQRRPCEAVRDFAQYLKLGDAMWSYAIEGPETVPNSYINQPEPFDCKLLQVQPEDFVRPDAVPESLKEIEAKPSRSLWRPWTWIGTAKSRVRATESERAVRLRTKEPGEADQDASILGEDAPVDYRLDGCAMPSKRRQVQIKAHLDSLRLTPRSTTSKIRYPDDEENEPFDFDDEDFGDLSELTFVDDVSSLPPSPHSSHASTSEDPQRRDQQSESTTSSQHSSCIELAAPTKLRLVSPRPIQLFTFVYEDPSTWTADSKNTSNETSTDGCTSTPISEMASSDGDCSAVSSVCSTGFDNQEEEEEDDDDDDEAFFDAVEEF